MGQNHEVDIPPSYSFSSVQPNFLFLPAVTQTVAMTAGQKTARTSLPSASSPWAWAKSCFLKDMVTIRAKWTTRARAREERTPTVAAIVVCNTLIPLLCHPDSGSVWTVTKDASPSTMPTHCVSYGRDMWIAQLLCVRLSASLVEGPCSCRILWPIGALRTRHHGG